MLIPHDHLIGRPVMSLQTGAELARTKSILVDPRNLMIIAYELEGAMLTEQPSFLRIADIREISSLGMIIDSSEEFVGLDDVIKIREVYDFSFNIIGLNVYDDKKNRLGKTHSFNVDADSYVIEQLNVKRPLLKSLSDTELIIHRSQIKEVDNEKIIVKSGDTKQPLKQTIREYANPFRSHNAQPESMRTPYFRS